MGPGIVLTLLDGATRYLASKARKRSLDEDKRQLECLKVAFGADTPLADITSSRISEYKASRLNTASARTGRSLTAAAINRPLALLRHLLRLAHEEWEVLPTVPKIRLEKEPQGVFGGLSQTRKPSCWPRVPSHRTSTCRPWRPWPWKPGYGEASSLT